jgi:hypothetical protein
MGRCKITNIILIHNVVLGNIMVIVSAIQPNVPGFKPSRERWICKGDKSAVRLAYSENNTKPVNTFCGKIQYYSFKVSCIYSYHWIRVNIE